MLMKSACVPRWTVEGPQRQRGTPRCRWVPLHRTPHPMPRLWPRPQTPHLRYRQETLRKRITPKSMMHTFWFCITIHVFPPSVRVWSRTPSQHSTCPCSKSKSSLTRNAPTREHRPWTGPRKMNSSATYRTPQLPSHIHRLFLTILTKRHQKGFLLSSLPFCKI